MTAKAAAQLGFSDRAAHRLVYRPRRNDRASGCEIEGVNTVVVADAGFPECAAGLEEERLADLAAPNAHARGTEEWRAASRTE